jgi:hypothetical protein
VSKISGYKERIGGVRGKLGIVLSPFDVLRWICVEKLAGIRPNEWAFLCNAHIGETYLACGLMEAFRKEHNNEPVVAVLPKKYLPIARMFPAISRTITMEHLPIAFTSLIVSTLRNPRKGELLPILGFGCLGYEDLNCIDPQKMVLGLDRNARSSRPLKPSREAMAKANRAIKEAGLRPGRTAILFPGARTIRRMSATTWARVAHTLERKGWAVATNVVGDEKAIPGTVALRFSVEDASAVAEAAGWVIILRSGMCELLSSANCRKTFLYPKYRENYYNGEFKRNLNRYLMISGMRLPNTSDLKEFEINPSLSDREIRSILS